MFIEVNFMKAALLFALLAPLSLTAQANNVIRVNAPIAYTAPDSAAVPGTPSAPQDPTPEIPVEEPKPVKVCKQESSNQFGWVETNYYSNGKTDALRIRWDGVVIASLKGRDAKIHYANGYKYTKGSSIKIDNYDSYGYQYIHSGVCREEI